MKPIAIILLSALILISCKGIGKGNESVETEPQTEMTAVESASEIAELESIKRQAINFSKTVVPFIEKVLKDNQRKHEFEANESGIQHLDIFEKNGLRKIIAFSDKRYPKSIEPNYYEHFILFALEYDANIKAKNAYDAIKKIFEIEKEEYEHLGEEEKQRMRVIEISTKPGGMICQKGNYIFSLVETCRETPIGGKWEEYENLFLSCITAPEEAIMILNANCGQMKYREEKRKPVHE